MEKESGVWWARVHAAISTRPSPSSHFSLPRSSLRACALSLLSPPLSRLPNNSYSMCQVLGVPRGAGEAQIKGAYRKLAIQYHPDKTSGTAARQMSICGASASLFKTHPVACALSLAHSLPLSVCLSLSLYMHAHTHNVHLSLSLYPPSLS